VAARAPSIRALWGPAVVVVVLRFLYYGAVVRCFFAQDDFLLLRDASRSDLGDLLQAFNPLGGAFRWRPLSQPAWFMWVSVEPERSLMNILGLLALATVVVLAIRWHHERPSIVFGAAWFAIFLLPALWIPN